jgi:hypothetical protein
LDYAGLLQCVSTALNKEKKKKSIMFSIFVCFWWLGRI